MSEDDPTAADLEPLLYRTVERRKELEARVDELEAIVAEMQERLGAVEAVADVDLDGQVYEDMTKDEKVRRVQLALAREAARSNGRETYDYSDVLTVFDGKPSAPHAYDLMRAAAAEDGFAYRTDDERTNTLAVNLDRVSRPDIISALKTMRGDTPV